MPREQWQGNGSWAAFEIEWPEYDRIEEIWNGRPSTIAFSRDRISWAWA